MSPLEDGDQIAAGRLFRRIPNRRNYFDPRTRRPLLRAFAARRGDDGELSTHLEGVVSQEDILAMMDADPLLRSFGLCAIDVAAVRAELGARSEVIFKRDPDDPKLGHAHAVLTHLDDEELQAILLRHAQVITEPRDLQ